MSRCQVCGSVVPAVEYKPWVLRADMPTDDLIGIVLEALCGYSFLDLIEEQIQAERVIDREQYGLDVAEMHVLREALRLLKGRVESPPAVDEVGYVVVSPEDRQRLIEEYGLGDEDFEEGDDVAANA